MTLDTQSSTQGEPLLVDKPTAGKLLGGVCRRTVTNRVQQKKLKAKRVGRRSMIVYASIKQFVKGT